MHEDFSSFDPTAFNDGRGSFPERLRAYAPHGTRNRVKRKAEEQGISAGELIRRALSAYLDGERPPGRHAHAPA